MRLSAQNFFVEAAEAFFRDRLESEREAILRSAIMSEIRSASVWWKQLGMALLTAIVAPLLLGAIIAGALFFSAYPTPADFAKHFHAPGANPDTPSAAVPPAVAPSPAKPP